MRPCEQRRKENREEEFEIVPITLREPGPLVRLAAIAKYHQLQRLEHQKCIPHSLEADKSKIKVGFLPRPLLLACGLPSSPCALAWPLSVCTGGGGKDRELLGI